MRKVTLALTLLYACVSALQAQTAMTPEQLDSLCLLMSDEARTDTPLEVTDGTTMSYPMKDSFVAYLHNAYYTYGKKTRTATLKQTKEGALLRLAEGKLCIKEAGDFRKGKYLLPTEMVEAEYFFLNNRLVKTSITLGNTDYNALPQGYWITVSQLDVAYRDTEPEKKAIYHLSNPFSNPFLPIHRSAYPTNVLATDEWIKMAMQAAGIAEEQLQANAYRLFGLYILSKSLFTIKMCGS